MTIRFLHIFLISLVIVVILAVIPMRDNIPIWQIRLLYFGGSLFLLYGLYKAWNRTYRSQLVTIVMSVFVSLLVIAVLANSAVRVMFRHLIP